MLKNKCCLYVIISIRFFSITICNLLIEFPSYLLIKYIKSVLWRVAKCLSYIEEARCLKVKEDEGEMNRLRNSNYKAGNQAGSRSTKEYNTNAPSLPDRTQDEFTKDSYVK